MKHRQNVLFRILLVLMLITACQKPQADPIPIDSIQISVDKDLTLILTTTVGTINLVSTQETDLIISGTTRVLQDTQVSFTESEDELHFTVTLPVNKASNPRSEAVVLDVSVPVGVMVEIQIGQADVNLNAFEGNVRVNSISGNITGNDLSGDFYLRSGRGDIEVTNSHGNLSVVGEHGLLTMINAHGTIASNNIMGTIRFEGLIGPEDDVHLEADHGSIEVVLDQQSDVYTVANSAGGKATCPLPELPQTLLGCEGVVGDGSGLLTIRTVSGAITIRSSQ